MDPETAYFWRSLAPETTPFGKSMAPEMNMRLILGPERGVSEYVCVCGIKIFLLNRAACKILEP